MKKIHHEVSFDEYFLSKKKRKFGQTKMNKLNNDSMKIVNN